MWKRYGGVLLAFALLLPAQAVRAGTALPVDTGEAKAVCLMEVKSGALLLSHAAEEKMEAAGLVRLAPLLMACEAADAGEIAMEDEIAISAAAAAEKGATAFLTAGERIAAGELYKAGVMIGAGDAIHALSESLSASDEAFLAQMHERLAALGVDALYTDRMGTDVELSALELSKLGAALLQSPAFLAYSGLYYETLTHDSGLRTEMASSNKLLKSCAGTNGVGTGSSAQAGYCGVFSAERDGTAFLCTVLGAQNAAERAELAKAFLEYAFASYEVKRVAGGGEVLCPDVPVRGGAKESCDLVAAREQYLILPRQSGAYTEEVQIPETLDAPIRAGEALGRILYKDADGGLLAQVELTVREDVARATWQDYLKRLFAGFLHQ